MFSGIVEIIGKVITVKLVDGCKQFIIQPSFHFTDTKVGDSIAVNGVCLTVTEMTLDTFSVTAVPETLRLTNLSAIKENDLVNLERAMQPSTRIGGHYVQGHVDCTATIIDIKEDASAAWLIKISIDNTMTKYIINKGFITIDGMSITVIECQDNWFTITLIPHTQQVTIANQYKIGSTINIEVDMMAKYIEKIVGAYQHASVN